MPSRMSQGPVLTPPEELLGTDGHNLSCTTQRVPVPPFQGLPVVGDHAGLAHQLGRGFAHLTAEPAPLGHCQRVDGVHVAAGGSGLGRGCQARLDARRERPRGEAWLERHLGIVFDGVQLKTANSRWSSSPGRPGWWPGRDRLSPSSH